MQDLNEFLEDCILSGVVLNSKGLTQEEVVKIENILYRNEDLAAKVKIKRFLNVITHGIQRY